MKTFDKALQSVKKDVNLFGTNLQDGMKQSFSSDELTPIIIQLMQYYWKHYSHIQDKRLAQASICSLLQAMFSFGVLVGMEMEKTEVTK
jgi:hypothetical protein